VILLFNSNLNFHGFHIPMLNVASPQPPAPNDHTLCHMDNNKQWMSCNGLNWFSYIYSGLSKTFNCRPTKVTTSRLQTDPKTSVDSIVVIPIPIFYCRSTYIAVITSAHSLLIHLRKWRLFKLPEQPMGCELYLRFNLSCT
jgi:hypothetical protein